MKILLEAMTNTEIKQRAKMLFDKCSKKYFPIYIETKYTIFRSFPRITRNAKSWKWTSISKNTSNESEQKILKLIKRHKKNKIIV